MYGDYNQSEEQTKIAAYLRGPELTPESVELLNKLSALTPEREAALNKAFGTNYKVPQRTVPEIGDILKTVAVIAFGFAALRVVVKEARKFADNW